MSTPTVLVVDDERNTVEMLKPRLEHEGYQVETAYDAQSAMDKVRSSHPALIMLGLRLPEISRLEIIRRMRQVGPFPIIMLTSHGHDLDKVTGLELGADDIVTKPFNPREVSARIKAVLRRYAGYGQAQDIVKLGDLTIDVGSREASLAGRKLELRTKEFDLLATLARQPGVTFSCDQLLNLIWGCEHSGDRREIEIHEAWLREKLSGSSSQIQTVWGVGYKLVKR